MIFATSDNHFGHKKIIEYCNRPFSSLSDMNTCMLHNWNRVVGPDDTVIHLGDFSLMNPYMTVYLCKMLNGQIILINGNHDRRTRKFWEQRAGILKWFKRPQYFNGIWLTHRVDFKVDPFRIWTGKLDYKVIQKEDVVLHGHIHGKIKRFGQFINVGVDGWNFCPVPLSRIVKPAAEQHIKNWVEKIERESHAGSNGHVDAEFWTDRLNAGE